MQGRHVPPQRPGLVQRAQLGSVPPQRPGLVRRAQLGSVQGMAESSLRSSRRDARKASGRQRARPGPTRTRRAFSRLACAQFPGKRGLAVLVRCVHSFRGLTLSFVLFGLFLLVLLSPPRPTRFLRFFACLFFFFVHSSFLFFPFPTFPANQQALASRSHPRLFGLISASRFLVVFHILCISFSSFRCHLLAVGSQLAEALPDPSLGSSTLLNFWAPGSDLVGRASPAGWVPPGAAPCARMVPVPGRAVGAARPPPSGWDQRSQANCFSLSLNCGFYQESLFQRAQTRSSADSLISSADPHTPPRPLSPIHSTPTPSRTKASAARPLHGSR